MNELIKQNKSSLLQLCKKHKVENMFVFGSVLTDSFSDDSDIDFLVYFNNDIPLLEYSDNYFDLKFALEDLFERNIDLTEGSTLKNKYFIQELDKTKQLLYGQQSTKIPA